MPYFLEVVTDFEPGEVAVATGRGDLPGEHLEGGSLARAIDT